ncbi:YALI0E06413p [Yarrowia lipolytica CLIB122]|uniref:YALI0E06413p n=1 Tax=Yarrowia lipolytica (strain CLIB 122 / E 150) TaxID=284591 RepID=Q6C6T7_YARLI|nr:YALI0E06413p [Yarrowia lipolytica CLIB122]CAG79206.1 YALI0E06413p [Yarrowia lipolytica CLIB122]|eukprot:XP_503625.1 YALI0E06413p [Yarrowia lipolytica CLIB122]
MHTFFSQTSNLYQEHLHFSLKRLQAPVTSSITTVTSTTPNQNTPSTPPATTQFTNTVTAVSNTTMASTPRDNSASPQSSPKPVLVSRKSIVSFTEPVHPNDRHRNSVVSLHHIDHSKVLETNRRVSPTSSNGASGCTTPTIVKGRLETQSLDEILGSLGDTHAVASPNFNLHSVTSNPNLPTASPTLGPKTVSSAPVIKPAVSTPATASPTLTDSIFPPKTDSSKIHILIAASGSVATIKMPLIVQKLKTVYGDKVEVQAILTTAAQHFFSAEQQNEMIDLGVRIWKDKDEWTCWKKSSEKILNAELKKWADVLLIAPLSANTLCKIANGICDNLLTSIIRAWNPAAPIIVAPAMNTMMYNHPLTQKHLNVINAEMPWIQVLLPVEKKLVCGDTGIGAMLEWSQVVDCLVGRLSE